MEERRVRERGTLGRGYSVDPHLQWLVELSPLKACQRGWQKGEEGQEWSGSHTGRIRNIIMPLQPKSGKAISYAQAKAEAMLQQKRQTEAGLISNVSVFISLSLCLSVSVSVPVSFSVAVVGGSRKQFCG